MPAPDRFGVGHPHTGKCESGLRIAGAEGRQPGDVVDQRALRRGKRERRVDAEFRHKLDTVEAITQALGEKPTQSIQLIRRDGKTRRHCMAAAIDQQAGLARCDHRGT